MVYAFLFSSNEALQCGELARGFSLEDPLSINFYTHSGCPHVFSHVPWLSACGLEHDTALVFSHNSGQNDRREMFSVPAET